VPEEDNGNSLPLSGHCGRVGLMLHIRPIQAEQQEQIISATESYIYQASTRLEHTFEPIPVMFDLKGRAAGMYKVIKFRRIIRYNPYIFARYFSENLVTTVPHEVAHYIVDVLYGMKKTQPHGKEWKNLMAMFDADASVTCSYDLDGIPTKHYRRFDYFCSCRTHQLTCIRHNRVLKGTSYFCRHCKQELLRGSLK
jgi:SprT protein